MPKMQCKTRAEAGFQCLPPSMPGGQRDNVGGPETHAAQQGISENNMVQGKKNILWGEAGSVTSDLNCGKCWFLSHWQPSAWDTQGPGWQRCFTPTAQLKPSLPLQLQSHKCLAPEPARTGHLLCEFWAWVLCSWVSSSIK